MYVLGEQLRRFNQGTSLVSLIKRPLTYLYSLILAPSSL